MENDKNTLPVDLTYVGVLTDGSHYRITLLPSLLLDTEDRSKLVHFRSFPEALLALGYKEILRKLSLSSLTKLIIKTNPEMRDLKGDYLNLIAD